MNKMKATVSAALLMVAACMAGTGCSKEGLKDGNGKIDGEQVTVSLTTVVTGLETTRATIDGDGAGASADQCRLQIYMHQGTESTKVYDATKSVSSLTATFDDITLIRNQTYDFLFWADNKAGGFYNTDTLTKVKMVGTYVGNNDARDAFFAALTDQKVTEALTKTVELYRPFAQLNIITNDIPNIAAQLPEGTQLVNVVPNKVKVTFTAPNLFNVLTGEASGSADFTSEAAVYTTTYKTAAGDKNTLSMDYIYASATKSVNTIGFTAINDLAEGGLDDIVASFDNIPLQRNYRTNIQGNLITNAAVFTVEIKPAWETEEYDIEK